MFTHEYPYTDMHELNLDWIIQKMKDLDVDLKTIEDRVKAETLAATKAYVNEELAGIEAEFEEVKRVFNSTVAELEQDYVTFTNSIQSQITLMSQRIDDFRAEIDASIIGVNARTDMAIQQNNEYILEEISKGVIGAKVINYFTGARVTIQEMFDYLAKFHADNAITYDQLEQRDRTYTELAALNITYTQLAINGDILIV